LKVSPKIPGTTKGTIVVNPHFDRTLPSIIKDEWVAEMKYFMGLVP